MASRFLFGLAAIAGVLLMVGCAGCVGTRPPSRAPDKERVMSVTAYCNCGQCCGWKRNWRGRPIETATGRPKRIGLTASGAMARHGTVAAPRDIPFGTIVYVEGYGYGRVEDRGGAIKGDKLDLWFRSHRAALQWGRKNIRVKMWLPDSEGAAKTSPPPARRRRR